MLHRPRRAQAVPEAKLLPAYKKCHASLSKCWEETAYDPSGNRRATPNGDDDIFLALTPEEQASVNLRFSPIPNTASVWAAFDFVVGVTPGKRS